MDQDSTAALGLVRVVCSQRRAIIQFGEIVEINDRGHGLAVIADDDPAMSMPDQGDELIQVRLGGSQRVGSHGSESTC